LSSLQKSALPTCRSIGPDGDPVLDFANLTRDQAAAAPANNPVGADVTFGNTIVEDYGGWTAVAKEPARPRYRRPALLRWTLTPLELWPTVASVQLQTACLGLS
jgi:hypothetical protein